MVGFRGTVTQHHAETTVSLPLKGSSNGDSDSTVSLHELVTSIDGLKTGSRFYLAPSLCHGALQTMYIYGGDFSKTFQVYYGRRLIHLEDGGCVSADYVISPPADKDELNKFNELATQNFPGEDWPKLHPRTRYLSESEVAALKEPSSKSTKPLAVLNHGLAGGSHESYVRMIAEGLYNAGFDVVVLNCRGCARTKLTTPELFTGLHTDDLRDFVKLLQHEYPSRPLYAVGLSFGSTILANYLGEEEENSPFVASACLSNPWDMVDSAYHISNGLIGKNLFAESIAGTLARLVKSNRKVLMTNPQFKQNLLEKRKFHSTAEFDALFTAPFHGFQTAYQYYRAASSVNRLLKVQSPLLIINSTDDPVVGVHSIPDKEAEANPYVVLIKTDLGGHLAYVQSDGKNWAINRIVDFFAKVHDTVDESKKVVSDYKPSKSVYDYKLHY
ncbi:Medium-chain fatty acid ethyl ester synthase/esterase 2 [Cyberlindnera fabianii]|uniref:Medium-chain fatty acid ethyl ester synthase/esterase 2 n=1 Tax=Cyberlindnera fabianii TaxID=36022 RepID=A0A1V2L3U9_CYBFA|nr:Medium-chain fatty acid ethyl ester synthase/esterase 2 [Cyberlindnera fabianii]